MAVLDASVGVKWFRREGGTDEAHDLLARHGRGELAIVVASHFLHEVLSVALRERGAGTLADVWASLRDARLGVVHLDDELVAEASRRCRALRCTFYDALAPALATLLGGTLYSGDRRAHGAFSGVRIIGD